ncbi:MAG: prepilin-type N-terminal cleavage/methylation domain-containing protein [Pseudomonadota bacterium]
MSNERGSTLLETLIALSLTAMIAAALSQATGLGLRVTERVSATNVEAVDRLSALRRVAELLERIDPSSPDGVAAVGQSDVFRWRGVALTGDGRWRAGVWSLDAFGELSACEGFEGQCEPRDVFDAELAFEFWSENEWTADWPAGPAPEMIRVTINETTTIVTPRSSGARR